MDPKSLAKSKRSFTQAHSKKSHHPNQKQARSTGKCATGSSKKAPEKHAKEKVLISSGSSPSQHYNQDLLRDSSQLLVEVQSPDGEKSTTGNIVVNKSKGADYLALISKSEAPPSTNACLDPSAALDDFLPDFRQGLKSLISFRGHDEFSRIKDDNFIIDDEETTNPETPILSLDLPALAHRLGKVELSKRLFMDADILLPYDDVEQPHLPGGDKPNGPSTDSQEEAVFGSSRAALHPIVTDMTQLCSVQETYSLCPISAKDPSLSENWNGMDRQGEEEDKGKRMLLAEAELDMLLDSTVSIGSPGRSSGLSAVVAESAGGLISGFDAWLDTL